MSDLMLKLVLSWLDVSLLCVLIPVAIGGRIRISRAAAYAKARKRRKS
jgi:hypothetical protein